MWNGGGGKLVFFFVDQLPDHGCYGGAITTGTVGPFVGSVKISRQEPGDQDTPIPSERVVPGRRSRGLADQRDPYYLKLTKTVNGKTVAFDQSVGCKNGKRPYSVTFTPPSRWPAAVRHRVGLQKCS